MAEVGRITIVFIDEPHQSSQTTTKDNDQLAITKCVTAVVSVYGYVSDTYVISYNSHSLVPQRRVIPTKMTQILTWTFLFEAWLDFRFFFSSLIFTT